jgi:hypothetical protein
MARVDLVKRGFSFPRPLLERLDEVARGPGASKSRIVSEALLEWLDRKGSNEIDSKFAERLDQLSYQLNRIERNSHVELETLGLFVRYMLTVQAPLPEPDAETRAIGRHRFAAFVERVSQQLATGRHTLFPDDKRR